MLYFLNDSVFSPVDPMLTCLVLKTDLTAHEQSYLRQNTTKPPEVADKNSPYAIKIKY